MLQPTKYPKYFKKISKIERNRERQRTSNMHANLTSLQKYIYKHTFGTERNLKIYFILFHTILRRYLTIHSETVIDPSSQFYNLFHVSPSHRLQHTQNSLNCGIFCQDARTIFVYVILSLDLTSYTKGVQEYSLNIGKACLHHFDRKN